MVNLVAFWRFPAPRSLLRPGVRPDSDDRHGPGDGRRFRRWHRPLPLQRLGRDGRSQRPQRMTFVALTILGPLAAMVAILLIRRAAPILALAGSWRLADRRGSYPRQCRRWRTLRGDAAGPAGPAPAPHRHAPDGGARHHRRGRGRVRDALRRGVHGGGRRQGPLLRPDVLLRRRDGDAGARGRLGVVARGVGDDRAGLLHADRVLVRRETASPKRRPAPSSTPAPPTSGLYVGIFILVSQSGTSEISRTLEVGGTTAFAASLLVLLAAAGKSAQTPFQGWLQDAMVGPTPVSALLHSATLVAAGAICSYAPSRYSRRGTLLVVGALGGVTAVVTGLMAVADRDLKRLLAASTSSQYGFMLAGRGRGLARGRPRPPHRPRGDEELPLPRLRRLPARPRLHGLSRQLSGASDGNAPSSSPGSPWRGLALAGVPPLAGFWSKDAIIAATFESPYAWLLFPLALIGTALTGIYVARALRLLWKGEAQE